MSDLVEKVARAIDPAAWDGSASAQPFRQQSIEDARVAIAIVLEEAAKVAANNDDDCSYTSMVYTDRRRIAAEIRALKPKE